MFRLINKFKVGHFFLLLSCMVSLLSFANKAEAATLFFSPSTANVSVGNIVSVKIFVNTSGDPINNAEAVIQFPPDLLEVVSVSKSPSVFSLWVEEPTFSNASGIVKFNGGIPSPGYNGGGGSIASITFKAKAPGTASLLFSNAAVRKNDGLGTDILTSASSGTVKISVVEEPEPEPDPGPEPEPDNIGTPLAPQIKSSTHPDPNSWYAVSIAEFNWDLPVGTTGARLLVGEKPQSTPSITYVPAVSEKTLEALDDGIWYFHARLRNARGWGDVAHFRFQIDTVDPEYFNMEMVSETDLTNPTRSFTVDAHDVTSGVSHYTIQIDDGDAIEWYDEEETKIYTTPVLGPGRHTITMNVLDKAGNFLTNFEEFVIEPLDPPTITEYTEKLTNKDLFVVKGESYPNSQVVIWLQWGATEPQNYIVKTDTSGRFAFVAEEKLKDGNYQLWAEVIDERGARSEASEKLKVLVQPTKLWQIGIMTSNILSVTIPLIALLFLLVFMVWYLWLKLVVLRRRVRREANEAEMVLHKEFKALKKRLTAHIITIEKTGKRRKLTAIEKRLATQLRKELSVIEDKIEKEIEDIQKEVK